MPSNLHPYQFNITRADREKRLGQKGHVLWIYGLSGSGKSTIGNHLAMQLQSQGILNFSLDGDVLRNGLNKDLGFSSEERSENLRRAAEVAKVLVENGTFVIASFITPLEIDREQLRSILGKDDLSLLLVDCPLEICEERDPKSLYKKARKGDIPNFTGISSPFESDGSPDLIINSAEVSVEDAVLKITSYLSEKSLL